MGSFATGAKEPNWQAGVDNSLSTFMACVVMSDMLLGARLPAWQPDLVLRRDDDGLRDLLNHPQDDAGHRGERRDTGAGHHRQVGPGGNFLSQKHTRQHMRDLFLPQFMDRRPYNEWEDKQDEARDWALEKARRILADHQPDPLDPKVSRWHRFAERSSPRPKQRASSCNRLSQEGKYNMQPKIEPYSPKNLIHRILEEAFQLMMKPGIKVQSDPKRANLLAAAGAQVDEATEVVHIPEISGADEALETRSQPVLPVRPRWESDGYLWRRCSPFRSRFFRGPRARS